MKNPKANALRWLRQAEHDLQVAAKLLQGGDYSDAAFHSEQSAQKALKSVLISQGSRYVTIHSVGELAKQAAALEAAFLPLVDQAKRLDRHYIASRYPDALPEPAIPAESYVLSEAEDALRIARTIFDKCKSLVSPSSDP